VLPLADGLPARRFAIVNAILIAANLAVWLFYELPHLDSSIRQASFYPCTVDGSCNGPLPWEVSWFTSMFMHGSWDHILGNMLFLGVFGKNGRMRSANGYLASTPRRARRDRDADGHDAPRGHDGRRAGAEPRRERHDRRRPGPAPCSPERKRTQADRRLPSHPAWFPIRFLYQLFGANFGLSARPRTVGALRSSHTLAASSSASSSRRCSARVVSTWRATIPGPRRPGVGAQAPWRSPCGACHEFLRVAFASTMKLSGNVFARQADSANTPVVMMGA
jgi:hypothetical protein